MKWHRKKQQPEAKRPTIGDLMTAVAACQTTDEAQKVIDAETDWTMQLRPDLVREEARRIVMDNIGYVSGYFDRETAARILTLFGTRHPILGAIEDWPKTPEETLALGMKIGERAKGVA